MSGFPGELTPVRIESLRRRARSTLRGHRPALFHVRTLPIPTGEPAATLGQWQAAWAALHRFDGSEPTIEEASELVRLYARLDAFGVAFSPDARAWAAATRKAIGIDDAELSDSAAG